jgi:hypothetical protein
MSNAFVQANASRERNSLFQFFGFEDIAAKTGNQGISKRTDINHLLAIDALCNDPYEYSAIASKHVSRRKGKDN